MLSPEQIKQIAAQRGDTVVNPNATGRSATPSVNAAEEFAKNVGFDPRSTVQKVEDFASDTVGAVSRGIAKGEVATVKGLADVGLKIADQTVGRVGNAIAGNGFTPTNTANEKGFTQAVGGEENVEKLTEPEGVGENIGYGAEKIAEFFIPAGKAARAEEAINFITQGIKNPLFAASTRIAGKSTVQGVSAGGVEAVQTGGDVKKTLATTALGGGARAGFAVIGEGARALHLPERLYSTIFKNSSKDMLTELKSNGVAAFQKSNPQKFKELVDAGIIKVGEGGKPLINETLAEQALDRGLRGSIRGMANEVVGKTFETEDKVQKIARAYKGTVSMPEEQFPNVLRKIAAEYEDVGFGEISSEAKGLVDVLLKSKGEVSAEDALKVRRFLDRVRIASSFDKPVVNLSTSQGNLKTLADAVRQRVNSIPEMGPAMKDYAFYIDALDDLAKEAARRGNNQVLSLIDSLFLSGAYAGNNPIPGITMGTVRKILQSATGATRLGQMLNKGTFGGVSGGVSGAAAKGVVESFDEKSSQKDQL